MAKKDNEDAISKINAKLEDIWSVKYLPKKLNDLACTEDVKALLNKCITTGTLPNHLCFWGTPGTGKNSIVSVLRNSLDTHMLVINASEENGIDDIRGKVSSFANSGAFSNKPKILVMNEADGLTVNAQNSMRELMESRTMNCRFIFTCNNISKIIDPLLSRFSVYHINPPVKDIVRVLISILKVENVSYTADFVRKLVKIKGRDLRKLLNSAQELHQIYGELTESILDNNDSPYTEVFDMLFNTNEIKAMGDLVKENLFDDDVYTQLSEYCINKDFPSDCIPAIAESMYRSTLVYDKDLVFLSCIISIREILNASSKGV